MARQPRKISAILEKEWENPTHSKYILNTRIVLLRMISERILSRFKLSSAIFQHKLRDHQRRDGQRRNNIGQSSCIREKKEEKKFASSGCISRFLVSRSREISRLFPSRFSRNFHQISREIYVVNFVSTGRFQAINSADVKAKHMLKFYQTALFALRNTNNIY